MIQINSINKTFNKGQATENNAIQQLSLSINPKEFLVVVGSNGSGKSTLLNCIAGNILVDSGVIIFNKDKDVTALKDYQRTQWISRIFQNPLVGTAPDLSILDNFRLAAIRTQSKNIKVGINHEFVAKVKEHLATLKMGLENKIHQPVGSLSGGQRQAITLLMSVFDESSIFLLDEPTAALDPKSANIVMDTANHLISKLQLTAILVTHNLKEATTFGNRIIQMHQGKIIKDLQAKEKEKLTSTDIFQWFQ
ncbi:MAG: ATP-binding cassette domain-containing protein [Chitinophagaceae bacterium]|nr:ATP-binding cassette domain-containing protein [Chitinophagaceae bacterium]